VRISDGVVIVKHLSGSRNSLNTASKSSITIFKKPGNEYLFLTKHTFLNQHWRTVSLRTAQTGQPARLGETQTLVELSVAHPDLLEPVTKGWYICLKMGNNESSKPRISRLLC
jgi:hypothetical protein